MRLNTTARAFAVVLLASNAYAVEFRTIDGSGNNTTNPAWGEPNSELLRLVAPDYKDGLSQPRGGDPSTLPSARAISNAVSSQTGSIPNTQGATDWLWQWGQFIDHDLDLTGTNPADPFDIAVPLGDPIFDLGNTGTQKIEMNRSKYVVDANGVRQQVNQITAYLDGSQVYGSDSLRAEKLRSIDGLSGTLKTTTVNGEILLPRNTEGLANEGGPSPTLFVGGDVRANEQVGLTATHTLFVREHNRLAAQIKDRLMNPVTANDLELVGKLADAQASDPTLTQGDFIYESARKIVGAQIQVVTYNEFLPVLLGPDTLSPFTGYDDSVNAGVSNEFSTEAYRLHSLISSQLQRVNNDGSSAGSIALENAFFNPDDLANNGADTLLKGLASQAAQENDTQLVDGLRNLLFAPNAGLDLAALDLQRGRDHGIPSLNDFRESFLGAGSGYGTFLELTDGDVALADAFESLYTSVDDVDLWIGGLAEPHVNGGLLGETFQSIIIDQFTRTRDGDRFFFLNDSQLAHLEVLYGDFLAETTLADIIRRNTEITNIQDNAFLMPGWSAPGTVIPLPAAAWATLPLLGGIGAARLIRLRRQTVN